MSKARICNLILTFCSVSSIYSSNHFSAHSFPKNFDSQDFFLKSSSGALSETISTYWNQKLYDQLGVWFLKNIRHDCDLDMLYTIADSISADGLKNAIVATKHIVAQGTVVKISKGELLQLALFIETNIKSGVRSGSYHFNPTNTSLTRSVEVDPENGNIIIYLENKKSESVGKGRKKRFNIAILYSVDSPKIITTGFIDLPKNDPERRPRLLREAQIMRELGNKAGIVECHSVLQHDDISKDYDELVFAERLYRGGDVSGILHNKQYAFTIKEQAKLAYDFVKGLRSMHKYGIVHHDFHMGNYLVDVEIKNGKREVSGAITDFGRARFSNKNQLQKREKRYIFKIGVTLYGLFHNFHISRADVINQASKVEVISRRDTLLEKSKITSLSSSERYEYLILNMMHIDEDKRGSIQVVLTELKAIENLIKMES